MSEHLPEKSFIEYKDGYKYQLVSDYWIKLPVNPNKEFDREFLKLDLDGFLTIKKGYAWDGASGPTIDTKNSMRGSLVHDALYQLMRMRVLPQSYRKHADDLFYSILRKDGMSAIRAGVWYRSVDEAAAFAADPKNLKRTIIAP